MGRIDESIGCFQGLRDEEGSRGDLLSEAWNSYYFGETLLMRDSSGDRASAEEVLQETLEMTRDRGLVLLEGKVHTLIEGLAPVGTGAVGPSYPDGLSEREVEVLHHIARGMTNKEIGDALFISPSTVSSHLGSIFRKTGAANRAEATAYAARNGLIED